MITVSLCMIVKNEEEVLGRCLDSVQDLVDEIIIVDTGSIDRTKEIASTFTDNIFDFPWIDDFATARNHSFSKATKDYILWLDADDVLEGKNQASFKKLKSSIPSTVDSVMMHYHVDYDLSGYPTRTTKRNRLLKREKDFRWKGKVHEYLDVQGMIAQSQTAIHHRKEKQATSDRNLLIYRKLEKSGEVFSARDLLYYGNELVSHHFYKEALGMFDQFLTSREGWIEDNIAACVQVGVCQGKLGRKGKQMESLFQTFSYANPRSEVCCRIGELFLNGYYDMEKAIFWYQLALTLDAPTGITGLLNEPYTRTWLPHLQLSICYERQGFINQAIHHCERALELHQRLPKIQANLHILKKIKRDTEMGR